MQLTGDTLIHIVFLIIMGLLSFLSKKLIFDPAKETKDLLHKHIETCNEVPKSLIIEKLDNISRKQDDNHETFCDFRDETRVEIKVQREYYNNLNNAVQLMIGKTNGK